MPNSQPGGPGFSVRVALPLPLYPLFINAPDTRLMSLSPSCSGTALPGL